MERSFHIKKSRIVRDNNNSFTILTSVNKKSKKFYIPKNQIISKKEYEKRTTLIGKKPFKTKWVEISVTEFYWESVELYNVLNALHIKGDVFFNHDNGFGIDWDFVYHKIGNKSICFYCNEKFNKLSNKTRDHIISRSILKAYTISALPFNTVPCCKKCNNEKAYYHPSAWIKMVRLRLHETGDERYRVILFNLEKLISK